MAKARVNYSRRIKIHPRTMRPFVSRVVRDGRVQKAFKEAEWRKSLSNCVKSGVHEGMSQAEIYDVFATCALQHAPKGTKKLSL